MSNLQLALFKPSPLAGTRSPESSMPPYQPSDEGRPLNAQSPAQHKSRVLANLNLANMGANLHGVLESPVLLPMLQVRARSGRCGAARIARTRSSFLAPLS